MVRMNAKSNSQLNPKRAALPPPSLGPCPTFWYRYPSRIVQLRGREVMVDRYVTDQGSWGLEHHIPFQLHQEAAEK